MNFSAVAIFAEDSEAQKRRATDLVKTHVDVHCFIITYAYILDTVLDRVVIIITTTIVESTSQGTRVPPIAFVSQALPARPDEKFRDGSGARSRSGISAELLMGRGRREARGRKVAEWWDRPIPIGNRFNW